MRGQRLALLGIICFSLSLPACTGRQTTTQGLVMLSGKTYLVRTESRREMDENKGDSFAVSVDGGAGQWLPVGTAHGFGSIPVATVINTFDGAPNDEFKRVFDAWFTDAKARKNVQTQSRQYYLDGYGYPGEDPTHRSFRADGGRGESGSSQD